MVQYGKSSRSSWTKSVRSSFGRTILGKAIRESSITIYGWKKFQIGNVSLWNAYSLTEKRALLVCVCGRKKNWMGKTKRYPNVEDTHERRWFGRTDIIFLDHVYLGCTQRECKASKDIVDNYRDMFECRMSAGGTENFLYSGKSDSNISSWSYDMEGHTKTCVGRCCELANKTTQQLHKSCNSMHDLLEK